jgi:hypothetical protein
MSTIDIAHLIRTGEVKRIPKCTFSEYIIAVVDWHKENDWRIGQSYFNALTVLRPDISEKIRGTENDAFHDNNLLPAMMREVYRLW